MECRRVMPGRQPRFALIFCLALHIKPDRCTLIILAVLQFYDGDRNNGPYNVTTAASPVQLVWAPVRADNVSEIFASLG